MAHTGGYPIVLTADRTLIANYRLLFDGMLTASQTTVTPSPLMHSLLMPQARSHAGRASVAPLGLRRIEAALLGGGFSPEDVAVVTPEEVSRAIGPATRVVGVSAGEPTGLGMNSTTMATIVGGMIYPQAMFRKLMHRIQAVRPAQARVIMGGPGAWQLAAAPEIRRALGIDHVLTGYAEGNVAALFTQLLDGTPLPEVITGQPVEADGIPAIRGASSMGVVEISRGCGLGCDFCAIAGTPMVHLPVETILADAETNIAAGLTSIAVLSEDFFRYGGHGAKTNPSALLAMLARVRRLAGLRLIQIDHANVQSVAQYTDEELSEVRRLLVGETGCEYPWVNIGVETASGALLKACGGAAKMGRTAPEEWAALSTEQVRRLCRAGFFPMVSLVVGLPGEQEEDIRRTLAWVDEMRHERLSIFPVLYAPMDGQAGIRARDLRPWHWDLFKASYGQNFSWVPQMYWDNQAAADVPVALRMLLQALGRGQVLLWHTLFAWHAWRAR